MKGQPLLGADCVSNALGNSIALRTIEAHVETVVGQSLEFLRCAIVARADDRDLRFLDHLNELRHTTAITATHSVDFFHEKNLAFRSLSIAAGRSLTTGICILQRIDDQSGLSAA